MGEEEGKEGMVMALYQLATTPKIYEILEYPVRD